MFRAPTARTQNRGSTLLAVAGAGDPDGPAFITLHQNSTLHGLTVFYPEQEQTNPPTAYPWTVRGMGDNCSLVDVLLVNPYQAVDFGTHPAGRHYIKGLYEQPLYRGIFIDQCYDVGRVADVHLWPFWGGWEGELGRFTREQGIAFVIGRTDWEYLFNCFCIGFKRRKWSDLEILRAYGKSPFHLQTQPFCPHVQTQRQDGQCLSTQPGKALGTASS